MALRKKQILAVVYNAAGTLIKPWANFSFEGFTKELNAGVGECVLGLDVAFDYGGSDLVLGNTVELRVTDRDLTAATTPGEPAIVIYRGYISMIERDVSAQEKVVVHLLGFYTLLAMDILKDGNQTTLYSNSTTGLTTASGSQNSADIGLMMRTIIDRYRAENDNPKVSYNYEDIPDVGLTVTYSFQQKTYREALDILKGLAPAGLYWYADEAGNVKFKTASTTPQHKFIFGKHFNSVRVQQSVEKMRNFLLVWDGDPGGTYNHYQDDESIDIYGRRAHAINDYGSADPDAMDALGEKFLAENRQPEIKVICTIVDNNDDENKGYDIESIQPGNTCSFYGFDSDVTDIFRDNMLITSVKYSLDKVEIEVEVVKSGIIDLQSQQGQDINDIGTGGLGVPETYS